MTLRTRHWIVLTVLLMLLACSKVPPDATPEYVRLARIDEAQVWLGTLSHAAIALNGVNVGEPPKPLFSTENTRIVTDIVESTIKTLRKVPVSWKATVAAALSEIRTRLDAAGKAKFNNYLAAAEAAIGAL